MILSDIELKQNENLNMSKEVVSDKEQNSFLQTSLGKVINLGLDLGIRALLPDLIEDGVIEIKNAIFEGGFKEGIDTAIQSAIDFGKSVTGIFTGKFENISQVQTAVKNGGIIDGVSNVIDWALNKATENGKIPYTISNTIRQGKNVILNNVTKNIENEFEKQLDSIEKLDKYTNNWKNYYNEHDFEGMEREYGKIKEKLEDVLPIENTIKEVRKIENLHMLVKNNNGNFNLSKEEVELAQKLVI